MTILIDNPVIINNETTLDEIAYLDAMLYHQFKNKFLLQTELSRPLVSFQANKSRSIYKWYKFKEAFSASLVEYLLEKYKISDGTIIDPFAGIGTALFAASSRGIDADGIELLPIGQQVIQTKKILESNFTEEDFNTLKRWIEKCPWEHSQYREPLKEVNITRGAYSERTKEAIEKYMGLCHRENERVQAVLRFALLCILETVSFTRKDGQYLRWDHRSGRRQGKKIFQKGEIPEFRQAIVQKLDEIIFDLRNTNNCDNLFPIMQKSGAINLLKGSCLELMPHLPDMRYDAVLTSPPYCNRYDYTRTYALELAILGIDENEIHDLRQKMLSCTVENREKNLVKMNPRWIKAVNAVENQELLQAILTFLYDQKAQGALNNNGIPRMIRGYFTEMACVIAECSRVLKPGALFFMVNDNVRYAGAAISVDMILSDIAEKLGFTVENILVLPNGKGNSSQQMGEHGRETLRKCVYVWRKTG